MEIQHVYLKRRCDFGRQCNFYDRQPEIHCSIPPDVELSSSFVTRNPLDKEIQCQQQMAEHECNTELVTTDNRGLNHTEGGWPKDVNFHEVDQVTRFRKMVEKEDSYSACLAELSKRMEGCMKQNNVFNIYEEHFGPGDRIPWISSDRSPVEILNLFRLPTNHGERPNHISWIPDGPRKLAVAFCDLEFRDRPSTMSTINSYIWDVENSVRPEATLTPGHPLLCLEYNPKDSHLLAGGQKDGRMALFDTRRGSNPCGLTNREAGHRDAVRSITWIASKVGNECFSASADGKVMWWDGRKLSEPLETMSLNLFEAKLPSTNEAALCLEYEASLPMRFMVGTEGGHIMACSRKTKGMPEKVMAIYHAHSGGVRAIQRNPVVLKNFLSVGDWTFKIWAEDLKESPVWCSRYDRSLLTDGCWSPTRPGVVFTTKSNGTLDIWDLLVKQNEPMFQTTLSSDPLRCIRVHEGGSLLAAGSDDGVVTLLGLDRWLHFTDKNEKMVMMSMLERETRREKFLEAKHKELRNREVVRSTQISRLSYTCEKRDTTDGEALSRAEKSFLEAIEVEKRREVATSEDNEFQTIQLAATERRRPSDVPNPS